MGRQRKELERRLTIQQRAAAQTIVDNEFGILTEDGRKLTNVQLIERIGCGSNTFYVWKRDPDFVRYMNELADEMLDANRAFAYGQLMRLIKGGANGVSSVKALDLYFKRFGLLQEKLTIEDARDSDKTRKTDEQIAAEIIALDDLINNRKDVTH